MLQNYLSTRVVLIQRQGVLVMPTQAITSLTLTKLSPHRGDTVSYPPAAKRELEPNLADPDVQGSFPRESP